jgi:hypothetical protein
MYLNDLSTKPSFIKQNGDLGTVLHLQFEDFCWALLIDLLAPREWFVKGRGSLYWIFSLWGLYN